MVRVSRWVAVVVVYSSLACGTNKSNDAGGSGAGGKQIVAGGGGTTGGAGSGSIAGGGASTSTSAGGAGGATAAAGTGSATAGSSGAGSAADGGVDGGAVVDGGGSAAIPCTSAEWTAQCASSCPFAQDQVDCAAACKNLPTVCNGSCPQCMGVSLDTASCLAGCALYKGVTCYNRLLGCFVSNSTCEAVTVCANAHQ